MYLTFKTKSLVSTIFTFFLFLNLLFLGNNVQISTSQPDIPTYMVTTRTDNPNQPIEFQQGPGYNSQYQYGDVNQLLKSCPPKLVIFVHGGGVSQVSAMEQLDRVKMSLDKHSYNTSLLGFSLGSNIDWDQAKKLTKDQGIKLAQFISEYKDICENEQNRKTDVLPLGHSLGARVILNSLESLHSNPSWNDNNFTIPSVILLGAAVDNEEVSTNPIDVIADRTNTNSVKSAFGKAIQDEVGEFYNMNDREDNVLQIFYPFSESDHALGQSGFQTSPNITLPKNYEEVDVKDEIKAFFDADAINGTDMGLCNNFGSCNVNVGDNHLGYMGFRNLTDTSKLVDDGAMDSVVAEW